MGFSQPYTRSQLHPSSKKRRRPHALDFIEFLLEFWALALNLGVLLELELDVDCKAAHSVQELVHLLLLAGGSLGNKSFLNYACRF